MLSPDVLPLGWYHPSAMCSMIKEREAATRELVKILQLHGQRVSLKLEELFEPLLEDGEELPDYLLLQRLMTRAIRSSLVDLLAAEEAHQAVVEQIEDDGAGVEREPFLQARRAKTEADLELAIEAFDETYRGFAQLLEALYGLAGEDELAEQLRLEVLESEVAVPEPMLAEAEVPEPPDHGDGRSQIQRRILSRRGQHSGLSRWLGYRIFRRRPARR